MNTTRPCKRRHIIQLPAALAASHWLAACTTTPALPAKPTLAELGIYSAGQGSAFLPYATGLATYLSAQGLKTQALQSAGSIENIRKIDTEPQRLGTVFLGTAYEAVTGTGAWTQGRKFDNLRALFPMYETSFQLAALRASGLSSLAALQGKRVGVGPVGGPAESFLKGLLEATNIQATLVNGTPSALATDLIGGKIDALWQGAAVPIPALVQVLDGADAVVFGLSESEQASMLSRFPFLAKASVAANSYKGQTQALQSVAAWNFVMAHKDLSEPDAYWITRTALSAAKPAEQIHASAAPTRAVNAVTNTVVAFHPGATRFYREVGVRV